MSQADTGDRAMPGFRWAAGSIEGLRHEGTTNGILVVQVRRVRAISAKIPEPAAPLTGPQRLGAQGLPPVCITRTSKQCPVVPPPVRMPENGQVRL